MGIRRSFALASADRYFAVVLNFVTLLVTARLLTPAEFGVAVIGMSILGLTETLHNFGGTTYIVQVKQLTPERLQAVFTITFALTATLAALLLLAAQPIASFYDAPGLKAFLQITALCIMLGPFVTPLYAVMRRNLEFGKMAVLNGASVVVNTTATITLALLGFSYMSFALGSLIGGVVYLLLCWWLGPKEQIYRFTFADWREISAYGAYDSLTNLLNYARHALPMLAFGKTLGADGLGFYQRALSISMLPEKTMLAGLTPVLLPALSRHIREGRELKVALFYSIEYVTALFWPAMLVVAILANPIVEILLGHQWAQAVPIVQIIATAFLLQLPSSITSSVQIAAGAIRDCFIVALITVPMAIGVQAFASTYGLEMAAASLFLVCPLSGLVAIVMVRWRVPFEWSELWTILWRSGIVALFTALGPAAVAVYCGGTREVSIAAGIVGFVTAPIGWLIGLRVAGHPMLREVNLVRSVVLTLLSEQIPAGLQRRVSGLARVRIRKRP